MKKNTQIQTGIGSVANHDPSRIVSNIIQRGHAVGKMLSVAETIIGYALGIYVGLAFGAMAGTYIVGIRPEELLYTMNFSDPDQIEQWHDVPWIFARIGAAIGALLGAGLIAIIQAKFFRTQVASLYEDGVTEPEDIAGILGKSTRVIAKTMTKLAKKGMIDYQPDI